MKFFFSLTKPRSLFNVTGNHPHVVAVPVGLLLFALQLPIRLLEFVGQEFQISGQLVIGLELLGHQHQISGGVVQRYVADVQAASIRDEQTDKNNTTCQQQQHTRARASATHIAVR